MAQKKQDQDILDKMVLKLKSLSWQEWALIAIVAVAFFIFLSHISQYQQVPSPVFGGDYYRDRGFVKNIVEGNPVWSDGFYVNEFQYYPYFMVAIEAGIVKLTGASINDIFLLFPLVTLILGSITWYLLGNTLFKNKTAALITAVSFITLVYDTGPKSSSFAAFLLIPLFLYLWLKYELTDRTKYAIWAGAALGITALTQGSRFLTALSLIGIYIAITFLIDLYKNKRRLKIVKKYIKKYYALFLVALIISMIFFLPLILKYQMHQVNKVTEWGDAKLSSLNLPWVLKTFGKVFFNTSNIFLFIISIISLLGLALTILSKNNKRLRWLLIVFISNMIAIQHHFITKPLLDTSFLPQKLVYITVLSPFFFTLGIFFIWKKSSKKIGKKAFAALVIILLLTPVFVMRYNDKKESKWDQYGMEKSAYTESLYDLADWITANVGKDEAILSNDESGFMLAVLSGRKVMLTRRTHASYYIDIDKRIAEAAVAMYGNDINQSKDILDKYNVEYLYIDEHFIKYPMRTRPEFSSYLKENNITFEKVHDRYDIAIPVERANTLDLLIIPPQEVSESFMGLWAPVYEVRVGESTIGVLHKRK